MQPDQWSEQYIQVVAQLAGKSGQHFTRQALKQLEGCLYSLLCLVGRLNAVVTGYGLQHLTDFAHQPSEVIMGRKFLLFFLGGFFN